MRAPLEDVISHAKQRALPPVAATATPSATAPRVGGATPGTAKATSTARGATTAAVQAAATATGSSTDSANVGEGLLATTPTGRANPCRDATASSTVEAAAEFQHSAFQGRRDAAETHPQKPQEQCPDALVLGGYEDLLTKVQSPGRQECKGVQRQQHMKLHKDDQQQQEHQQRRHALQRPPPNHTHQRHREQQGESGQQPQRHVADNKDRDVVASQPQQCDALQRHHHQGEEMDVQQEEAAALQKEQQSKVLDIQQPSTAPPLPHSQRPALPERGQLQEQMQAGRAALGQHQSPILTQKSCLGEPSFQSLTELRVLKEEPPKQRREKHALPLPTGRPLDDVDVDASTPQQDYQQTMERLEQKHQQQHTRPYGEEFYLKREEHRLGSQACSLAAPQLQPRYFGADSAAGNHTERLAQKQQHQHKLAGGCQQEARKQDPIVRQRQPAQKELQKMRQQQQQLREEQYCRQGQSKQLQHNEGENRQQPGHRKSLQQGGEQLPWLQGQEQQGRTHDTHESQSLQPQKQNHGHRHDEPAEQQLPGADQQQGQHRRQQIMHTTTQHGVDNRDENTQDMLLLQKQRNQQLLDSCVESVGCLDLPRHDRQTSAATRERAKADAEAPTPGVQPEATVRERVGRDQAAADATIPGVPPQAPMIEEVGRAISTTNRGRLLVAGATGVAWAIKTATAARAASAAAAEESAAAPPDGSVSAPPAKGALKAASDSLGEGSLTCTAVTQCLSACRSHVNIKADDNKCSNPKSCTGYCSASCTAGRTTSAYRNTSDEKPAGDVLRRSCKCCWSGHEDAEVTIISQQRNAQREWEQLSLLLHLHRQIQQWSRLCEQHQEQPVNRLVAASVMGAAVASAAPEEQRVLADRPLFYSDTPEEEQPLVGLVAQQLAEELSSSLAALGDAVADAISLFIVAVPAAGTVFAACHQDAAPVCAPAATLNPTARREVGTQHPAAAVVALTGANTVAPSSAASPHTTLHGVRAASSGFPVADAAFPVLPNAVTAAPDSAASASPPTAAAVAKFLCDTTAAAASLTDYPSNGPEKTPLPADVLGSQRPPYPVAQHSQTVAKGNNASTDTMRTAATARSTTACTPENDTSTESAIAAAARTGPAAVPNENPLFTAAAPHRAGLASRLLPLENDLHGEASQPSRAVQHASDAGPVNSVGAAAPGEWRSLALKASAVGSVKETEAKALQLPEAVALQAGSSVSSFQRDSSAGGRPPLAANGFHTPVATVVVRRRKSPYQQQQEEGLQQQTQTGHHTGRAAHHKEEGEGKKNPQQSHVHKCPQQHEKKPHQQKRRKSRSAPKGGVEPESADAERFTQIAVAAQKDTAAAASNDTYGPGCISFLTSAGAANLLPSQSLLQDAGKTATASFDATAAVDIPAGDNVHTCSLPEPRVCSDLSTARGDAPHDTSTPVATVGAPTDNSAAIRTAAPTAPVGRFALGCAVLAAAATPPATSTGNLPVADATGGMSVPVQRLYAGAPEEVQNDKQVAAADYAAVCPKVSDVKREEYQKLRACYSDCWMCLTSSSGESTSPSPLPSAAALSPLSVTSSSPTSPVFQQTPLPPPLLSPAAGAESGRLAAIETKEGVTERHETIQLHHQTTSPVLQQQPHLVLQQQPRRLLVPPLRPQEQVRYFLLRSTRRQPNVRVPLEQVPQSYGLVQLEQQTGMRLLDAEEQQTQRQSRILHSMKKPQHKQLLTHSPVSNHHNHQQEREGVSQPRRDVATVPQPAIPCIDEKCAATSLQQCQLPLLLPAIRQVLLSLRHLALLISHVLHSADCATATMETNARPQPGKDDKASRGGDSSWSSSGTSVGDTSANGDSGRGCCVADHSSHTFWTTGNDTSSAVHDALCSSHMRLLELSRLGANRRSQHIEAPAAATTTATASRQAVTSAPEQCTTAACPQLLLASMKPEASQQHTSLKDNTRPILSLLRRKFVTLYQQNQTDLAAASSAGAVQGSFNAPGQPRAATEAVLTASSRKLCEDYTAERFSANAAETRHTDVERHVGSPPIATATCVLTDSRDVADARSSVDASECADGATNDGTDGAAENAAEDSARRHRATAVDQFANVAELSASPENFVFTAEPPAGTVASNAAVAAEICSAATGAGVLDLAAVAQAVAPAVTTCTADGSRRRSDSSPAAPCSAPDFPCAAAVAGPVSHREALSYLAAVIAVAISVTYKVLRTYLNLTSHPVPTKSVREVSAAQDRAAHTGAVVALLASNVGAVAAPANAAAACDDGLMPPAGTLAVPLTNAKGGAQGEQVRPETSNNQPASTVKRATTSKSSAPLETHVASIGGFSVAGDHDAKAAASAAADDAGAAVEPASNAVTAASCHLTRTLRRGRSLRQSVFQNQFCEGTDAAAVAGVATGAAEQQEYHSSDSSYVSCSKGCFSNCRRCWGSSSVCSSEGSYSGCNSSKGKLCAIGGWPSLWDCSSSSEDECGSLFSSGTGLDDDSEEQDTIESSFQGILSTKKPTTADVTDESDRVDEVALPASASVLAGCGEHKTLTGKAAPATFPSPTVLATEACSTHTRKHAAGRREHEGRAVLQRRQRLALQRRQQRSLLLLRGCWVMCVSRSTCVGSVANTCPTGKSKCGTKHRRRSGSNSRCSVSSGICSVTSTNAARHAHRRRWVANATVAASHNLQRPSEGMQLRRRYLFVSPDFQYICCSDIPPPSAAASFQEIACPLAPVRQHTRGRKQQPQKQQQHMRARQIELQQTPRQQQQPRQHPQHAQLQPQQQEWQKELLRGEHHVAQAHPADTLQRLQQHQGQQSHGEAHHAHQRHRDPEPIHPANQNYFQLPEHTQIQQGERQQQPPRQRQHSTDWRWEQGNGRWQLLPAEKGNPQQQQEHKEHWRGQRNAPGKRLFARELPGTDKREALLFSSSVATEEKQLLYFEDQMKATTGAAEIYEVDENKFSQQEQGWSSNREAAKWHLRSSPRELCNTVRCPPEETSTDNSEYEIGKNRSSGSKCEADNRGSSHCCKDRPEREECNSSSGTGQRSSVDPLGMHQMRICSAKTGSRFRRKSTSSNALLEFPTEGSRSGRNPRCRTLVTSSAENSRRTASCGQIQYSRQQSVNGYLHTWSTVQYGMRRNSYSDSGNGEGNANSRRDVKGGRKRRSIGGPFEFSSTVLGYGSLKSTTDISKCIVENPGKPAKQRLSSLLSAAPVLAPLSCAWFCPEDVSLRFKSVRRNGRSSGIVSDLCNLSGSSGHGSGISWQENQQRQKLQRATSDMLKQQQREAQKHEMQSRQQPEPSSAHHQQQLKVVHSSRQKQQEQQHQDEEWLVGFSGTGVFCPVLSSSSNKQQPSDRQRQQQPRRPALIHASRSPSSAREEALADLRDSLFADARSNNAASTSAACGLPVSCIDNSNRTSASAGAIVASYSAKKAPQLEQREAVAAVESAAPETEVKSEERGIRQISAAAQATPAKFTAATAFATRDSDSDCCGQRWEGTRSCDRSGSSKRRSGSSNSGRSLRLGSSCSGSVRRNSWCSSTNVHGKEIPFLAEVLKQVDGDGTTPPREHSLPSAAATCARALAGDICCMQAADASSAGCAAAAAPPSTSRADILCSTSHPPPAVPDCYMARAAASLSASPAVAAAAAALEDLHSIGEQRNLGPLQASDRSYLHRLTVRSSPGMGVAEAANGVETAATRVLVAFGATTAAASPSNSMRPFSATVSEQQLQQQQEPLRCTSTHSKIPTAALQQDDEPGTLYIPLKRVCSLEYGYRSTTYQRLQRSHRPSLQAIPPYLCCSIRVSLPEPPEGPGSAPSALQHSHLPARLEEEQLPMQDQEMHDQQQNPRWPTGTQADLDFVSLTASDAARWVIGLNGLIPYSPDRVLYTEEEVKKQMRVMVRHEKQRRQLERSLRHWRGAGVALPRRTPNSVSRSQLLRSSSEGCLLSCRSNRPPRSNESGNNARYCTSRNRDGSIKNCYITRSGTTRRNRSSNTTRCRASTATQCRRSLCVKSKRLQLSRSPNITRTGRWRRSRSRASSSTYQESSSGDVCHARWFGRCHSSSSTLSLISSSKSFGKWTVTRCAHSDNRGRYSAYRCFVRQDAHRSHVVPSLHSRSKNSRSYSSWSTKSSCSSSYWHRLKGNKRKCKWSSRNGSNAEKHVNDTQPVICSGNADLEEKRRRVRSDLSHNCFSRGSVHGELPADAASCAKERQHHYTHALPLLRRSSSAATANSEVCKVTNKSISCSRSWHNPSSPSRLLLPAAATAAETNASSRTRSSAEGHADLHPCLAVPFLRRAATARGYSAPPSSLGVGKEHERLQCPASSPKAAAVGSGRLSPVASSVSAVAPHCYAADKYCSAVDVSATSGAGVHCSCAEGCNSLGAAAEPASAARKSKSADLGKKALQPFFRKLLRFATLRWNVTLRSLSRTKSCSSVRHCSSYSDCRDDNRRNSSSRLRNDGVGSTRRSSGTIRSSGSLGLKRSSSGAVYDCGLDCLASVQHCCRCSHPTTTPLHDSCSHISPCRDCWSSLNTCWSAPKMAFKHNEGDATPGPATATTAALRGEKSTPQQETLTPAKQLEPWPRQLQQGQQHGQKTPPRAWQPQQVDSRTEQQCACSAQQQLPQPAGPSGRHRLYALQERRQQQMSPVHVQQHQLQWTAEKACMRCRSFTSLGLMCIPHTSCTPSTRCSSTSSLSSVSCSPLLRTVSALECVAWPGEPGCGSCSCRILFAETQDQQQPRQEQPPQRKTAQQKHDICHTRQDILEQRQEQQKGQYQQQPCSWHSYSPGKELCVLRPQQYPCWTPSCPCCCGEMCSGNLANRSAWGSIIRIHENSSCSCIPNVITNTPSHSSTCFDHSTPLKSSSCSTTHRGIVFHDSCSWEECICPARAACNSIARRCCSSERCCIISPDSSLVHDDGDAASNTAVARTAASPAATTVTAHSATPAGGSGAPGSAGAAATGMTSYTITPVEERTEDSCSTVPQESDRQLPGKFEDKQLHPNQQQQHLQELQEHQDELQSRPQQTPHWKQPAEPTLEDQYQMRPVKRQEGCYESSDGAQQESSVVPHEKTVAATSTAEEDNEFHMCQQQVCESGQPPADMTRGEEAKATVTVQENEGGESENDEESVLFSAY